IMVQAGPPVDAVLGQLLPLLEKGDLVMDCGNSLYQDTERRDAQINPTGINFFGVGVSGGEEGALKGPSIMPGGPAEGCKLVVPIPTIEGALWGRNVSAFKDQRVAAADVLKGPTPAGAIKGAERDRLIEAVRQGLYASKIASYAQGMAMLASASVEKRYDLK